MASAEQILSIRDLRAGVGGVGDAEDILLSGMRDSAIRVIEHHIGRYLIDRTVTTTERDFYYHADPSRLVFRISDVKPDQAVTLRYSESDADPSGTGAETMTATPATEAKINVSDGWLVWYSEPERAWTDILRIEHPVPVLTAQVGIPATPVPPEIANAAGLIVRALYDGSMFDTIPSNSIVGTMLKHYRPFKNTVAGF